MLLLKRNLMDICKFIQKFPPAARNIVVFLCPHPLIQCNTTVHTMQSTTLCKSDICQGVNMCHVCWAINTRENTTAHCLFFESQRYEYLQQVIDTYGNKWISLTLCMYPLYFLCILHTPMDWIHGLMDWIMHVFCVFPKKKPSCFVLHNSCKTCEFQVLILRFQVARACLLTKKLA